MRTNQKGFTLIELLIVVAISGALATVLIPSIFHIYSVNGTINDEVTGTLQVQNAARWISNDAKLAADTDLADGAPAVGSMTLHWINLYDDINEEHSVQYYVSDGKLKRNYDGSVSTVALYISNIEFSLNGSVITVDITCTPDNPPGQSERGIYNVTIRQ